MEVFTANSHWRISFLAVLLVSDSLQLLGVERSGVFRFSCYPPPASLLSPIQTSYLSLPEVTNLPPYSLPPGKERLLDPPLISLFSVRPVEWEVSTMIFFLSTSPFPSLQSNWKIKQQITMVRTMTFFMLFVCHLDIIVWIHSDISWMEMLEKWLVFQNNVSHYIHSNWLW